LPLALFLAERKGLGMAKGDLLSVPCTWRWIPYRHFGVDIGDGTVVHLATIPSSVPSNQRRMQVQRVPLEKFSEGKPVRIEQVSNPHPPEEVVARALTLLGRSDYHIVVGNCEHLARECKSGHRVSHQSDRLVRGILRAGLAGLVAASTRAATTAVAAGVPRTLVTNSAGVASLLGEAARHSAYMASRCANVEHRHAEKIGKSVGVTTVAVAGMVTGGPLAGVASAAFYLSIDTISQSAFDGWSRWFERPIDAESESQTVESITVQRSEPT
jgi:hypothetical protein